jgi:hypothetical protein
LTRMGYQPPYSGNNSPQSSRPALGWGMSSVIASRTAALLVAGFAGLVALHLSRASAQWWHRAPTDYEDCTEAADKLVTKEEKSAAVAECSAKFAGRRKPNGSGYTYYDFMQDRSFDIAGPNPTPEEQKYIDQQYTAYLEKQRQSNIAAAFAKQQQQQMQLEQTSLQSEAPATAKVPVPQERPKALGEAKPRCPRHTFSCEWPRLSESLNDLKKIFGNQPSKGKKSESRS